MSDGGPWPFPEGWRSWSDTQRHEWAYVSDPAEAVSSAEREWRKNAVREWENERSRPRYGDVTEVVQATIVEPMELDPSAPPPCPNLNDTRHYWATCQHCQFRAIWARNSAQAQWDARKAVGLVDETVYGNDLWDRPPMTTLFGIGDVIISAEGQPWSIWGADGTGKTTSGQHYTKGRLGLPGFETMWDMPITPLPEDRTVLYLALDRTHQIQDGMVRGTVRERDEERMRRLVLKPNTLYGLATEAGLAWMLSQVEEHRAGLVVIDSRKDIGGTLDPESISGINEVVRTLANDLVEVLTLGHTNEKWRKGPPTIESISGHREVSSGHGSIIILDGDTSAATNSVHHVKAIRELMAPIEIQNNHATGIAAVIGPAGSGSGPTQMTIVVNGVAKSITLAASAVQNRVMPLIDGNATANPDGWVLSSLLMQLLGVSKLDRVFREIRDIGLIEHNGKMGPQSAWRRVPTS